MKRLTQSFDIYLKKHLSFYNDLIQVVNTVPTGITIYCICLGKSIFQRLFLMCLIYLLEPKHTFIYDRDWKLNEYFNQFKNITIYNYDINPHTNLGTNIFLYSPYCPFNTPIYTLFKYNLHNLFYKFYYIGITSELIFDNINSNLQYEPIYESIVNYVRHNKCEIVFIQNDREKYIGKSLIWFKHNPNLKGFKSEIKRYTLSLPNIIYPLSYVQMIKKDKIFTSVNLICKIKEYCAQYKPPDNILIQKEKSKQSRSKIFENIFVGYNDESEESFDRNKFETMKYQVPEISKPQPNPRYSMWKHWPKIYDQESTNTCSVNAYCSAYKFMTDDKYFEPSRLFLDYQARVEEEKQLKNPGVPPQRVIDYVSKYGVVPERLWKFTKEFINKKPSIDIQSQASKGKFGQRFNIPISNNLINTLNFCLAKDIPVIMSMNTHKSFDNIGPDGILQMPNPIEYYYRDDPIDPYTGKHTVVIIGYDDIKKLYEVVNSYGPEWGNEGRFFMPYAYVKNQRLVNSFYVIAPTKPNLISPLSHIVTKFL